MPQVSPGLLWCTHLSTVFLMVHGFLTILPTIIKLDEEQKTRHFGTCTLDFRTGTVAAARFRTRVSRQVYVRAWTMAGQHGLLRDQLLDLGNHRGRY